MKRLTTLMVVLLIAGCGGKTMVTKTVRVALPPACPQAADGHGTMGGCAPTSIGLSNNKSAVFVSPAAITYPDLSNNNPVSDSQMAAIARHHQLVYLKVNQGTGFLDRTFMSMAASARRHGMATGGYDFVSCYCAAEANVFVNQLRLAGMTRTSARWAPPVLDVEYASANRAGLLTMLQILRREFGRASVYTGAWYWVPHLGCFWPGDPGWLAGYPNASPVCGMPDAAFVAHQFSDRAYNGATSSDMTVWRGTAASFQRFAGLTAPHPPKPKPHTRITRADQAECKHLQYDRRHKPPYLGAAHRRWRALHDVGVSCSRRHGAYLTNHRRKP